MGMITIDNALVRMTSSTCRTDGAQAPSRLLSRFLPALSFSTIRIWLDKRAADRGRSERRTEHSWIPPRSVDHGPPPAAQNKARHKPALLLMCEGYHTALELSWPAWC
jgi:hypothetical protein